MRDSNAVTPDKNHLFLQVDEIEEDVKAIIEPIMDHSKHVHAKACHTSNSSQNQMGEPKV